MNRICLLKSVSVLALALCAGSANAQSMDPYGYGRMQSPPPLPAFRAQQAAPAVYATPHYMPVARVAYQQPGTVLQPQVQGQQTYTYAAQATAPQVTVSAPTYQAQVQQPQYQQYQLPPVQQQASIATAPAYDNYQATTTYQTTTTTPAYPQPSYQVQAQAPQAQVQTYGYQPQQQVQTYSYQQQPAVTTQTTTTQTYETAQAPVVEANTSFASEPKSSKNKPWYFAIRTGLTIPQDTAFTRGGAKWEELYETGWQLGTAIGYDFNGWNSWVAPRAELELAYDQSGIDSVKVAGVETKDPGAFGNVRSLNMLANGYLDFRVNRILSPYIGGGVGVGYSDFDRIGTSALGPVMDDNDAGFIWQVMGGLGFNLSPGETFDVGYRYMQNTGLTLKARDGTTSTTEAGKHVFMLGLRESF